MSGLCAQVIDAFGSTVERSDLEQRPWYMVPGRAGPNAVLKLFIAPYRQLPGYVLTVARRPETRVVAHEVEILGRLLSAAPSPLHDTIPKVLGHGRVGGCPYFGVPFYRSYGHGRFARRLARAKRMRWIVDWNIQLARATAARGLSSSMLESAFGPSIAIIQGDCTVKADVRRMLVGSLDTILRRVSEIQSICCHGDLWAGNILWQKGSRDAVVLDWGAARWPGLPCMDLCRFLLANRQSDEVIAMETTRYCRAIELDPLLVPKLYDLYNVFIKGELEEAFKNRHEKPFNPFVGDHDLTSRRLLGILQAFAASGV